MPEKGEVGQGTWAASAQGCLPTSGQTLWDAEFSKCFKSQLKHRKSRVECKEASFSLVTEQDRSVCLERPPRCQEQCLHVFTCPGLCRVGAEEMLALEAELHDLPSATHTHTHTHRHVFEDYVSVFKFSLS